MSTRKQQAMAAGYIDMITAEGGGVSLLLLVKRCSDLSKPFLAFDVTHDVMSEINPAEWELFT